MFRVVLDEHILDLIVTCDAPIGVSTNDCIRGNKLKCRSSVRQFQGSRVMPSKRATCGIKTAKCGCGLFQMATVMIAAGDDCGGDDGNSYYDPMDDCSDCGNPNCTCQFYNR